MRIKNRLWIESDKGILLGQGRLNLLLAIRKSGSINKASKELGMSYRKAWKLVDQINERSLKPIVIRITGGKNGGGTAITDYGNELIEQYQLLVVKCNQFLLNEMELLNRN